MTFARQKRLLVGALALLAPIPLPFSDVIGWPVLGLYLVGVLIFLLRAWRDAPGWLPPWGLNVLGLAYLPLLGADLLVLHRGHLVAPVLHLALFALLVKLFALVRERDKWQAAIGIFFLFLAAMGTSVHPTIALYLAAFLVLALVLLMRFAFFHVLADFSRDDPSLARLPLGWLLLGSTVFVLLLAVPLFAALPRLRSPYIIGRGNGTGVVQEAAGFSDAVTLDAIDQIRVSRAVAIRVQFERGGVPPDAGQEMRFKAATYDVYLHGNWRRTPSSGLLQRRPGGLFVLAAGRPERWLHVWLRPLHSRSLPVPIDALQIEPRVAGIDVDRGGALSFPFSPIELREYRVGIGSRPALLGLRPQSAPLARLAPLTPLPPLPPLPARPPSTASEPTLDRGGLTPRIAELAARAAGQGSAAEQAARLERQLSENYTYTLDLGGRAADENPIDSFLFRYRSGQCEYFASAMVLMLRARGIPARLVTGFLGGEFNPFEGYLVLRDSNAHAWVEAYLGSREGWRTYDPTPPSGRPEPSAAGYSLLLRQAWDFVQFRWDRYVLTYGLYDQLAVFGELRRMWQHGLAFFERPRHRPPAGPAAPENPAAPGTPDAGAHGPAALFGRWLAWLLRSPWPAMGVLAVLTMGVWLWRRLHRPLDATLAYSRIRGQLARAGLHITPALPPLALQSLAARRFPAAASATRQVITFYLRESFGGQPLADLELAGLRAALAEAETQLRRNAAA